ncbi:MAG: lysozyme, partial [Shewanella sp.]
MLTLHEQQEALNLALPIIARFEGLRLHPYLCPAGVPTIGYGSTRYVDGKAVSLNDTPISQAAAWRLMEAQTQREYLAGALRLCPGVQSVEMLAALTDFAYNLGVVRLKNSTLRKVVNRGDYERVPTELRKWVYASGKRLNGLARRREAEIALLSLGQTQHWGELVVE